jgi:hypothetical protein
MEGINVAESHDMKLYSLVQSYDNIRGYNAQDRILDDWKFTYFRISAESGNFEARRDTRCYGTALQTRTLPGNGSVSVNWRPQQIYIK